MRLILRWLMWLLRLLPISMIWTALQLSVGSLVLQRWFDILERWFGLHPAAKADSPTLETQP